MILGREFLRNAEVNISSDGLTFQKTKNEQKSESTFINNLLTINLSDNIEAPDSIKDMIANYNPNNTEEFQISTRIVLKDDERIYHNPKRLSLSEKEIVEKQIDVWLKEGVIQESNTEYASPFPNIEEQIDKLKEKIMNRQISNYIISNDIIYKQRDGRNVIVVPDNMADSILKDRHEENGHFGFKKLEYLTNQQFEIENLKTKIES